MLTSFSVGGSILPAVVPLAVEALKSPSPALRRLSVKQLGRVLQVNCYKRGPCESFVAISATVTLFLVSSKVVNVLCRVP